MTILPCNTSTRACLLAVMTACGGSTGGNGDGADAAIVGPSDAGYEGTPDDLDTATDCAGVYNPDQILSYHFEIDAGDLNTILGDLTYEIVVPAQMRCGTGPEIQVGIRRKRSGGMRKVGFKIDINEYVDGQTFFDLRKLSLENGVSSGETSDGAEVRDYVAEYLSWRAMVLSGAIAGRAALAEVSINGESFGVYINVEQPDKRFLESRLGDDEGCLYKKSGGDGDGFKTHETDGLEDPYEAYFCFWRSGNSCPAPSADELAADLPLRLDIPQLLRVGAVNAIIANADSPIFKDNNYYWYDWPRGRIYLPWDLDTAWKQNFSVFTGSGDPTYTSVLFTHWRPDYEAIVRELVEDKLTVEALSAELERVRSLAAGPFAADPYVTGTVEDAVDDLAAYYASRHQAVLAELAP